MARATLGLAMALLVVLGASAAASGARGEAARPVADGHPTTARLVFLADAPDLLTPPAGAIADPGDALADLRLAVADADLTVLAETPAAGGEDLTASHGRLLVAAGIAVADAGGDPSGHGGAAGGRAVLLAAPGPGAPVAETAVLDANGLRVALVAAADPGADQPDDTARSEAAAMARTAADVVAVILRDGQPSGHVPPGGLDGADLVVGPAVAPALAAVPTARSEAEAVAIGAAPAAGPGAVAAARRDSPGASAPADASFTALEVTAGRDGVTAWRQGAFQWAGGALVFGGWRPPAGDAAFLDDGWWTPTVAITDDRPSLPAAAVRGFPWAITAASAGDVDADGSPDVAIAFRRASRPGEVMLPGPPERWMDAAGMTAHLGLFRWSDLHQIWVAGTLALPVARVAACDGSLAVAYSTLRDPALVAAAAWRWQGFTFLSSDELPGPGTPACSDVDGDGRTDPAIIGRSSR